MQPLFEHRSVFAGYRTRVLELEGDGPPLLLLHGYSDSADTWRHALARIARAGRAAIAVDLPGFGAAADLRPGAILPQLDAFARDALASLGPGAVVAGNSLGGVVALRLAQRPPENLRAVVAVAPAGLDMAPWFALIERDRVLRFLLSVPAPVPPAVIRQAVGRIYTTLAFADRRRIEPGVVTAFTGHFVGRAWAARMLATGRRLLPELRSPYELGRVSVPVLLVWGTKDRMVSPTGADRILAALPETRVELLAGCGHCPQIEEPDRFAELLLDFVPAMAHSSSEA